MIPLLVRPNVFGLWLHQTNKWEKKINIYQIQRTIAFHFELSFEFAELNDPIDIFFSYDWTQVFIISIWMEKRDDQYIYDILISDWHSIWTHYEDLVQSSPRISVAIELNRQ